MKPASLLAIGLVVATLPATTFATSHVIGVIDADTISGTTGITPAVSGITFDDLLPGEPLVGTNSGLHLARLDPTNAAILQLYNLPASNTVRSLDYIGNGLYYQIRGQPNTLHVLNPLFGTATPIGTGLDSTLFNIIDTAIDPTTGKLWAISDRNGGELLQINTLTGVATREGYIAGLNHVVSLAIDPTGRFFVSNSSGESTIENQVFQLNPTTLAATPVATTGFRGSDILLDFAFDPTDKKWLGIIDNSSTPTRQWLLVSLDFPGSANLPEPASLLLLASTLPLLARRRKYL
jgi:hypothetical protein